MGKVPFDKVSLLTPKLDSKLTKKLSMVLKSGHFRKQIRNTSKDFKLGVGERRKSAGPIV